MVGLERVRGIEPPSSAWEAFAVTQFCRFLRGKSWTKARPNRGPFVNRQAVYRSFTATGRKRGCNLARP